MKYKRNPSDFLLKIWWLIRFLIHLPLVSDRAGESPRLKSLRCRETTKSSGHEQAIQFCKLKSGKLKRRKNANLFERVYAVIGVDSSFAFSFLRVLPEPNLQGSEESRGSHLSFFYLWTIMDLFGSQIFLIFAP